MEHLQIIWFVLIGILFAGYSLLDGFDLGIGSLLPFLAKDDRETGALLSSIWPVWDGNEVWLLAGGGALFAAFPHAYATIFSGFYLAFMLVLFSLIFRAVSFEFWGLDEPRRRLWRATFIVGSLLPTILYGIALGNVIQGIPLDESMEFTGTFFTLIRPFPVAVGLLTCAGAALHGCAYAAIKVEGPVRDRAQKIGGIVALFFALMVAISIVLSYLYINPGFLRVAGWACAFFALFAAGGSWILFRRRSALPPFIASSSAILLLWGAAGASLFPALVRSAGPGGDITIYSASSSELTLTVMLIIACIGMPIVIGYTIFAYRIFKGAIGT